MNESKIFSKETNKSVKEVAERIRKKAENYGFIVRYDTDMANEFKEHGVEVEEGFQYHTIMLCIPKKAYKSVNMNPKRAAMIMPKQVSIYRDNKINKTTISFLFIGSDFVKGLLSRDEKIQKSLPESCNKVVELIMDVVENG